MDSRKTSQKEHIESSLPRSYIIYAGIIHWITVISAIAALFIPIIILASPQNNTLNPNIVYNEILSGATPSEIWALTPTGSFPGAHYYFQFLGLADSWAFLFINLGSAAGFFGLIPTVIMQITKEKDWFCAGFGVILAILILLSMSGILLIETG